MKSFQFVAPMAVSIALSACSGSGGGSGIASTPPPLLTSSPTPTPGSSGTSTPAPTVVSTSVIVTTPATPATRVGTLDTLALLTDRNATPTARLAGSSQVRITNTTPPSSTEAAYTIEFAPGYLPGNFLTLAGVIEGQSVDVSASGSFGTYTDGTKGKYPVGFGQQLVATNTYSDGSQKVLLTHDVLQGATEQKTEQYAPNQVLWHQLIYNTGLSHVSLGEWAWKSVTIGSDGRWLAMTDSGSVYFVAGDRTPTAQIPVSGTATYTARSLGVDTDASNDFWYGASAVIGLTADFGQRTMAAQLNRDYYIDGDNIGGYTATWGMDVSGKGAIATSGDFAIPLIGTLFSDANSKPLAVTGSLNGAFFGPAAEQVGGVFAVGQVPGTSMVRDAFVGLRN